MWIADTAPGSAMCHHHLAGADTAWEQGATCNGHTESEPSLALLELRFILRLPGTYRGEYSWLLEAENVPNVSG